MSDVHSSQGGRGGEVNGMKPVWRFGCRINPLGGHVLLFQDRARGSRGGRIHVGAERVSLTTKMETTTTGNPGRVSRL